MVGNWACGFSVLLPAEFLMWAALGRVRPTSLSLAACSPALFWASLPNYLVENPRSP